MTFIDDEFSTPEEVQTPPEASGETVDTARHSFLVLDCGNSNTSAMLFDVVAGAYRFIAHGSSPTTINAPWSDAIRGVQQAIQQITGSTGRLLLDGQGILRKPTRADGSGVDYFGALVSAADPLRVIVVGLLEDVSLHSARRVLDAIYAREVDCFSLSDGRSQQEQLDAIVSHKPDLVFISGGTDGGADRRLMQLVQTVALSVGMLEPEQRPEVVFAGNSHLRPKVAEAFGGTVNLHVVANVRPTLETEKLDEAIGMIGQLYETQKINIVPGLEELFNWSSFPIMPTAHAFAGIIEYFAALYRGRVLALDVGSDSVTFVSAEPEKMQLSVRSDLGMGRPLANLLDIIEPSEILDWSIPKMSAAGLRDFIINRSLHPGTIPDMDEELQIEQAIVRQIIRTTADDAFQSWGWTGATQVPPFKLLLLRGRSLTHVPRPSQAILMALDSLQPAGIFSVAMDQHGVLPSLGLLAPYEPMLVVQALEGGVLTDLGWVIAPTGQARPGEKVLNVRMESEDTGTLQIEVIYGTLEVLPLAPGQSAELTLQPLKRFDIGLGPGKGKKIRVHGGAVGLVIDARGRPLELPEDAEERSNQVRQWLWDVGG